MNSRPSIARLRLVVEHLAGGATAEQAAERIEVSEKTVRRDIDLLRDFLGYDMEYDNAQRRWRVKIPKERVL